MKKLYKLLAVVLALGLLATACGGSDDDGDTAADVDTSAVDDALAEAEAARAEAEEAQAAADEAQSAIDAAEAARAEAEEAADAARAEAEEAAAAAEEAAAAAAEEGDVNPLAGTAVRITGPERNPNEAGALQAALDIFAEENDMTIFYVGSADWEAEINVQLEAGNPPDISVFPQPGKLADFARAGSVLPITDDLLAIAEANFTDAANGFGIVDGVQYGIPNKSDLKSLVWYKPAAFEANGYEVPTTLDEFYALADQMIADGNTPLCVGIESGQATGWPFTDWVEDMMLRRYSPEQYDAWVAGELPFASPEVSGVMQEILDLWNTEGMVYADSGTIASTAFQANGEPLVNGDCMMHRQASFFAAFIPEGTPFADGSEDAVDVFYFPEGDTGRPVLGAGTLVGAFDDRPEVWAVMEYLSSADFANARQVAQKELGGTDLSGFLSPHVDADLSLWAPLEQSFLSVLAGAEVLRFDGSDLMPADVGAGTFWTQGTAMVNGDVTVEEGAAAIDASYPTE